MRWLVFIFAVGMLAMPASANEEPSRYPRVVLGVRGDSIPIIMLRQSDGEVWGTYSGMEFRVHEHDGVACLNNHTHSTHWAAWSAWPLRPGAALHDESNGWEFVVLETTNEEHGVWVISYGVGYGVLLGMITDFFSLIVGIVLVGPSRQAASAIRE